MNMFSKQVLERAHSKLAADQRKFEAQCAALATPANRIYGGSTQHERGARSPLGGTAKPQQERI
jgi:hypothetical protein